MYRLEAKLYGIFFQFLRYISRACTDWRLVTGTVWGADKVTSRAHVQIGGGTGQYSSQVYPLHLARMYRLEEPFNLGKEKNKTVTSRAHAQIGGFIFLSSLKYILLLQLARMYRLVRLPCPSPLSKVGFFYVKF